MVSKSRIIHISYGELFRYKGVTFEWHRYLGPTIINRHTEKERQHRNISLRVWSLVSKFSWLSEREKQRFNLIK